MGIGAESDKIEAAKDLMRFIASEEAGPTIRQTGLEPLFPIIE